MTELGFGLWSVWLQTLSSFSCPLPLPLASLGDTGKALKFCCLFGFLVLLIELASQDFSEQVEEEHRESTKPS